MRVKVFVDTNIIVDVLVGNRVHSEASKRIFALVFGNRIEGVIAAHSLIDASYILRGEVDVPDFLRNVNKLCNSFNIHYVDTFAINYACNNPTGDFEDDAMYHVAKLSFCDVIVTSDKLFKERHQGEDPNIQIMTPEEFVAKITVS